MSMVTSQISDNSFLEGTGDIPQCALAASYARTIYLVALSEPVPKVRPSGKNCTALMSDSWPANVSTALSVRLSHNLAKASQALEMKTC